MSQGSTSITYGLLPDYIHPECMAPGYSILYSLTSIAAAAGPWLVGLTADSYSLGIAFELMAIVPLLSLVPFFYHPTSQKQGNHNCEQNTNACPAIELNGATAHPIASRHKCIKIEGLVNVEIQA